MTEAAIGTDPSNRQILTEMEYWMVLKLRGTNPLEPCDAIEEHMLPFNNLRYS
jgi:hypothetical protein